MMMGFVMAVIWKLVKSGCVCAGTRILLSLGFAHSNCPWGRVFAPLSCLGGFAKGQPPGGLKSK